MKSKFPESISVPLVASLATLLAMLSVHAAEPAASAAQSQPAKPFFSCGSFTRSGQPGCAPLAVPPRAHEDVRQRQSEQAQARRSMRASIHSAMAAGALESQLRQQVAAAGGTQGATAFMLPDSTHLETIPADPRNPLTPAKVALGQLLFHETGLAANPVKPSDLGTYSCASCHHADAGFASGLIQGIGEGGAGFGPKGSLRHKAADMPAADVDVQPIATPPVLNAAWQDVMLWNGQFGATGANSGTEYAWTVNTPKAVNKLGYQGVESQAIAGLTVHRLIDDKQPANTQVSVLGRKDLSYQALFAKAFPDRSSATRISQETTGLAIAAYERTLVADQAPFQRWLKGDNAALTANQKQGALVFFGAGQCVQCHSGPSLAGMQFHALGLKDLDTAPGAIIKDPKFQEPLGRGSFTGREAEMYQFKVPQLYNLKDHPAFGHGASQPSVRAMLDYKNRGIPENPRVPTKALADEFQPLGLSSTQLDALADFLENGLFDASLRRYLPTSLPSKLCFPDNDPASRQDPNSFCTQ